MKIIEREGKTTSKVIESFMNEFDLTLNDFKFEVVEKESSRLFGLLGSKPARLKFTFSEINEGIKEFTEELFKKLDFSYGELSLSESDTNFNLEIKDARDPGHIIGKEAKLLDSIEYLLNQIANKQGKPGKRISLDVDGYRERRKEALLKKVKSVAEKVKKRGKSITLEAMHAGNRRIVHQYIENEPKLKTMTIGKGEFKRVVILPADQNKPAETKRRTVKKSKI